LPLHVTLQVKKLKRKLFYLSKILLIIGIFFLKLFLPEANLKMLNTKISLLGQKSLKFTIPEEKVYV